ncbi:MAG: hypothetical protein PHT48_13025 [Dechloromonas sp.]|nr:hypothetical protein [Dechloromonas sp.]
MDDFHPLAAALDAAGLNRQHIFNGHDLPADCLATLPPRAPEQQLILIGHAGRRLWDCVQAATLPGPDPIDTYSQRTVDRVFAQFLPGRPYQLLYPGPRLIGLQALGHQAGWHQPSPFMVGIDPHWGSWFAYRLVLLVDSHFLPTPRVDRAHPCLTCQSTPCLSACPPGALKDGRFDLARCSDWRLQADSPCAEACLARNACPVGSEHQYDPAQIAHSYRRSLAMLRDWRMRK